MALPPLSSFTTNTASNAPASPGVLPSLSSFGNQSLASQNLGMGLAGGNTPIAPTQGQQKPGFFKRVGQDFGKLSDSAYGAAKTADNSAINAIGSASDEANATMTHQQSAPAGAFGAFSDLAHPLLKTAGLIFKPVEKVEQGLETATGSAADSLTGRAQGTSNANLNQSQANATAAVNAWAAKHPDGAKELKGIYDAFQVGATIDGAETAADGFPDAVNDVATTVKGKFNQAINSDVVSNTIGQGAEAAQRANIVAKQTTTANDATGQVLQGKSGDVPRGQSALSTVDTSGIKTYADGVKVLNDKIAEVADAHNTASDSSHPAPVHPDDMTYQGHNYVNDALDQLEDFYQKTNDVAGQAKIKALRTQADTVGLKPSEINQLAQLHGQTIKAFGANGELSTGLSKQAAENTRLGLKGTERTILGDPAFQASDKQMSDLINTRDLFQDMADNVQKASQKIVKPGVIGKVGTVLAHGFDIATGGGLKSFFNYFLKNAASGATKLDAIDLEGALQKNLSLLRKLNNPNISDADTLSTLQQIADQGPTQKALPKGRSTGVTDNTSINLPENTQSTLDANETANTVNSKIITPKNKSIPQSVTQIFSDTKNGRFAPSKTSGIKIGDIKPPKK